MRVACGAAHCLLLPFFKPLAQVLQIASLVMLLFLSAAVIKHCVSNTYLHFVHYMPKDRVLIDLSYLYCGDIIKTF